MKHVLAAIIAVSALAAVLGPSLVVDDEKPTNKFATFERRVRSEVWAEGALRIRHGDFKTAREALEWMQVAWPKVEGEVFEPLAKEEAEAGQDLEKLADLWEARSK